MDDSAADWIGDPSKSLVPPEARTGSKPRSQTKGPTKAPARPIKTTAQSVAAEAQPDRAPTEDELRDELAHAPAAPKVDQGKPRRGKPKSHTPAGDSGGGRRGDRAKGEIFDDCPVTPLGVNGDWCYYLDVHGQMRATKKHEAQTIQSLFGHQIPRLCYKFPQWRKTDGGAFERVPHRFDQTLASMVMYEAASEAGLFNPDNAVRGVGAWAGDNGELIYHCGDTVLIDGKPEKPGRHGKRIYPAAPPIPHPNDTSEAPDPVPPILDTLGTWNWTAPDLHPFLALGMIGVQMLCGALDWRPVFWLLAPAAAGKSEFQRLLKLLHGDDGLVQSNDATERGITSKIKHSSLPVSLDELEPGDERSTKERDIIKLARVAASGGEWFRGSADQSSVGGKIYSAFLFSSILIPGVMKTQDVQRLIRLELAPIKKGTPKLNLVPKTWRARGARLKRLLIDRWPTWPERMAAWRHSLELAGVGGRDADNWGTVLAMADMASNEDIADEDVRANWAGKVAFLASAGRDDTMNDSEAMLLHLLAQPFDVYRRGQLFTVAQWIMATASLPGRPSGLLAEHDDPTSATDRRNEGNARLATIGLRVTGSGEDAKLFIANQRIHGLNELFRGTEWAGGTWKQSTARVPGAQPSPNPLTLAGIRSRGYFVPIKSIPGLSYFPMDRGSDDDAPPAQPSSATDGHSMDDWG